ncbi:MAG: transporter [Prevotellaceae bacterium]|nr:transporter [Prevotellaceae bacterium]
MSIKRFVKNWTLPVAMGLGMTIYLLFHIVPILQPVGRWYFPYNGKMLPICAFAVLYVTFCKIEFRKLKPVRWHLWLGIEQIMLVAIIMVFIIGFHAQGEPLILMEATLVCVISPGAMAAAVVTAKLGGNLEEMTTYTLISNFISAILIPLCFLALPSISATAEEGTVRFVHLFLAILWKVSVILLLPMLAALLTKIILPPVHQLITSVRDLSYYLWAFSLMVITGTTLMNIVSAWATTTFFFLFAVALMALFVCAGQFALGRYMGRFCGKKIETGQGLGQKNTTFAIWIATAFLNPLSSVGPGCYILWQNIVNSVEIWHQRRKGIELSS